jgi:hypothetical protein
MNRNEYAMKYYHKHKKKIKQTRDKLKEQYNEKRRKDRESNNEAAVKQREYMSKYYTKKRKEILQKWKARYYIKRLEACLLKLNVGREVERMKNYLKKNFDKFPEDRKEEIEKYLQVPSKAVRKKSKKHAKGSDLGSDA